MSSHPCFPCCRKMCCTAGSLCSAGATPRPHSYGPIRHPLVFRRFPDSQLYGVPCSAPFRDGTRRVSPVAQRVLVTVPPLPTPPKWASTLASVCRSHAAFTPVSRAGPSGLPLFRGYICVRFRCGPVTRSHPFDGIVDRLQVLDCSPPCYPSYRASGCCPGGTYLPLNAPAFRWTHETVLWFP